MRPAKRGPEDYWVPEPITFADLDDSPVRYRIDGLWPYQAHLLLSAYRKAGKTTLTLELLRCLSTGEPFLDRSVTKVSGTIAYVNLELSQQMLRKYAHDRAINLDSKKLRVIDYRGKATRLEVTDSEYREQFADMLAKIDCEVLVIDPLSPIMATQGLNSDSPDEARMVLEMFGELADEAGVDLAIIDHTGHADKSRSRGASGKEDWADVLWNIQTEGSDNARKLSVIGRGVESEIIRYAKAEDGQLQVSGGAYHDGPAPESYLSSEGLTYEQFGKKCDLSKSWAKQYAQKLASQGKACIVRGAGRRPDLVYAPDNEE